MSGRASPAQTAPLPPPLDPPPSAGSAPGARRSSISFRDNNSEPIPPHQGALVKAGQGVAARPNGEWLRDWTATKHSTAPFATDYYMRVPASKKEVRFASRSITAERVLGREPPLGMLSGLPQTPSRAHQMDTLLAAGQKSGNFNTDLDKIGLMNGRYGSRAL